MGNWGCGRRGYGKFYKIAACAYQCFRIWMSINENRLRDGRMQVSKERITSNAVNTEVVDLIALVERLKSFSPQELFQKIRDAEHSIIRPGTVNLSYAEVGTKGFGRIPIHLIARLLQANSDVGFRYFLSGLSLLHKLYCTAPERRRLQKMLLDDPFVFKQSVDLIIYIPTIINLFIKEIQISTHATILHSTITACSLYFLQELVYPSWPGLVFPEWPELVGVLVKYPRGDRFMDAAFAAIRVDVQHLQMMLSFPAEAPCFGSSTSDLEMIAHQCQQCEASLQYMHTLCQHELFQDFLVKHKECGKAGVLLLARCVLKLNVSRSVDELKYVVAAVTRMKSKVLSILVCLCEIENISYLDEVESTASISYLDEVAKTPESFDFAKDVIVEVLELLQTLFSGRYKEQHSCQNKIIHKDILEINSMQLMNILSDDTNFRPYITVHFTEVLTPILLLQHEEFLSTWCGSDALLWEDAIPNYDPFVAANWVLRIPSLSGRSLEMNSESTDTPCITPPDSYAHQRTSLLVKVIGNLHLFDPDLCTDEKDLFLNSIFSQLYTEIFQPPDGAAEKADCISNNLRSLLTFAESVIKGWLTDVDLELLRGFVNQLDKLLTTVSRANHDQESELGKKSMDIFASLGISDFIQGDRNEDINTKNVEHIIKSGFAGAQEAGNADAMQVADKHQKRGKTAKLMNDTQISLIEKVILDKPDMHRHWDLLEFWARQLSELGSEVTAGQLKNWLNNRKARLARETKDVHEQSDTDIPNKQGDSVMGPSTDPAKRKCTRPKERPDISEIGQNVILVNEQGEQVGLGKVYQTDGLWFDIKLEELGVRVVDIVELMCERRARLPYPCQATGSSFDQAAKRIGVMRVLWDSSKMLILQ